MKQIYSKLDVYINKNKQLSCESSSQQKLHQENSNSSLPASRGNSIYEINSFSNCKLDKLRDQSSSLDLMSVKSAIQLEREEINN